MEFRIRIVEFRTLLCGHAASHAYATPRREHGPKNSANARHARCCEKITRPAADACLDFSSGSHKRLAHRGVFGMAVEPDWRRIGIGQGLLTVFIEWAKKNPNLEKICLAVISTNSRALALYEKMGFQEEGRRVREVQFGNNNYVDDILMYRFVE